MYSLSSTRLQALQEEPCLSLLSMCPEGKECMLGGQISDGVCGISLRSATNTSISRGESSTTLFIISDTSELKFKYESMKTDTIIIIFYK